MKKNYLSELARPVFVLSIILVFVFSGCQPNSEELLTCCGGRPLATLVFKMGLAELLI